MIELLDEYDTALLVIGLAAFGVVGLPRILADRPLSYPVIYVLGGAAFFSLPFGFPTPDPIAWSDATERLTEFGVIVALMGAGIGVSRPPGLRSWLPTWRLLAITMPLTIAAVAWLGWWAIGLTPAAAVLLGAVLAPTDPVLASDVQVLGPSADEDEVRFALTSEAGLNDGLAFPFANLALLMAVEGASPANWWGEFLLVEVFFKLSVGLGAGIGVGKLLSFAIFDRRSPLPQTMDGLIALSATLISFAAAEIAGGYGFLAVFVSAVMIRRAESRHEYHEAMHAFVNQIERVVTAVILILFGGAVATGLFTAIGGADLAIAVAVVLLVRPVAGMIGLGGLSIRFREKAAIAFFGIRGVGSFYYLAHAINQTEFAQADRLWRLVGLVVVTSILIHGFTASPAMAYLDRKRPS